MTLEEALKDLEAHLSSLPDNGDVPEKHFLQDQIDRIKKHLEPKSVAEKRAEAGAPVGRSAAPRQTADAPTAPEEKANPNTMVPDKAADVQGSGNVEVPKPESKG